MTTSVTLSHNSPFSMPAVDNPIVEEKSLPEKIALYCIKSAVQVPIHFGVMYGSLYTMEKTFRLTSAIADGIYSTTSSILNNAYCAAATCTPETINTAVGFALNATDAADSTGFAENAVASHRWMTKGDISMLAAMGIPIKPVANHCFRQLLGCREDTSLRNAAAIVASSITTTALSSYATNLLGFETDTTWLIKNNLIGLALVPALLYTAAKLQQMVEDDEELLPTQDIVEIPANDIELESTRVKDLSDSTLTKIQEINRNAFQAL